jgi:hypothetical protein
LIYGAEEEQVGYIERHIKYLYTNTHTYKYGRKKRIINIFARIYMHSKGVDAVRGGGEGRYQEKRKNNG